jgi:predicted esterase
MPVDVALGTEDAFFDDSLLKTTASVLDANDVPYSTHTFEGGHAIDTELLQRLLD